MAEQGKGGGFFSFVVVGWLSRVFPLSMTDFGQEPPERAASPLFFDEPMTDPLPSWPPPDDLQLVYDEFPKYWSTDMNTPPSHHAPHCCTSSKLLSSMQNPEQRAESAECTNFLKLMRGGRTSLQKRLNNDGLLHTHSPEFVPDILQTVKMAYARLHPICKNYGVYLKCVEQLVETSQRCVDTSMDSKPLLPDWVNAFFCVHNQHEKLLNHIKTVMGPLANELTLTEKVIQQYEETFGEKEECVECIICMEAVEKPQSSTKEMDIFTSKSSIITVMNCCGAQFHQACVDEYKRTKPPHTPFKCLKCQREHVWMSVDPTEPQDEPSSTSLPPPLVAAVPLRPHRSSPPHNPEEECRAEISLNNIHNEPRQRRPPTVTNVTSTRNQSYTKIIRTVVVNETQTHTPRKRKGSLPSSGPTPEKRRKQTPPPSPTIDSETGPEKQGKEKPGQSVHGDADNPIHLLDELDD